MARFVHLPVLGYVRKRKFCAQDIQSTRMDAKVNLPVTTEQQASIQLSSALIRQIVLYIATKLNSNVQLGWMRRDAKHLMSVLNK